MPPSVCRNWLKRCALALLISNAILPASASAQAPVYITQWGSTAGDGYLIYPLGLATDRSNNVYVLDYFGSGDYRVVIFTGAGAYLTQWDLGHSPGPIERTAMAVDMTGNVYITRHIIYDGMDNITTGSVTKYTNAGLFNGGLGGNQIPFCGPNPADGTLGHPNGVATDESGNVYVTDASCDRFRVQKFTNTGAYLTKWGSGGSGDGEFNFPCGVAVDAAGDVYVTDFTSARIQKFTSTGTYLTQWGSPGGGDGQFYEPRGVAVDGAGNVYVADTGNYRIQMFTSSGGYIAQWGGPGSGNGEFNDARHVATDALGNVYVLDQGNHRIQKFGHVPTPTNATTWGRLKRMYR